MITKIFDKLTGKHILKTRIAALEQGYYIFRDSYNSLVQECKALNDSYHRLTHEVEMLKSEIDRMADKLFENTRTIEELKTEITKLREQYEANRITQSETTNMSNIHEVTPDDLQELLQESEILPEKRKDPIPKPEVKAITQESPKIIEPEEKPVVQDAPEQEKSGILELIPIHKKIMAYIANNTGCSNADVARGIKMNPSTISVNMKFLLEKGLVKRDIDKKYSVV